VIRRGRRETELDPWTAYLSQVEPAIASAPRVHLFAQPPLIGDPGERPAPIALWIEDSRDPAATDRTRLAVEASTTPPAGVLTGSLADALGQTRAEYVALVHAGDEPAPLALERMGQAAAMAATAAGAPRVITSDDDLLGPDGARTEPRFRPGPSPDRWLACDDSGPLLVVSRAGAAATLPRLSGGEAWRHELALRLAGAAAEHHAHVPMLLCHRDAARPEPAPLAAPALERVLGDWGQAARTRQDGPVRTVERPLSEEPSVEVIVCLRDKPELLARCVVSLLARTRYERFTIALVDNGSEAAETLELLNGLARHPRVRVLRDSRPFNFAALNNQAVATSAADVVVFLNNDTEVTEESWVERLLEQAIRPEVGAVAPMLLYPDGLVQHAGAALGLHGYAGHPFAGLTPDAATPFGTPADGTRNWLAVTAACMAVEREKFRAVGGFDETFVVAGNDVDLCLRLTAAGYRSLCVSEAVLMHDESRSRGAHIDPGDFVASERSYGAFRTVGDPFYNPNLTTRGTDCSVRQPGE
jgi:O-antigen biosynthesis protein